MTREQIKAVQSRIGTTPDGFWGPASIAACQSHLRNMMPHPHPFPSTDQGSLTEFYGKPGDESQLVSMDVGGLGVCYDDSPVRTIRVHHRLEASLLSVLTDIAASPFAWVLAKYAGTYNNRPMRGGSLPSLHARGAAIDLWPEENGNKTSWPVYAMMPLQVMEIFAKHGWLAAGAFWGRDGMHFEATR